jgi:hypothetical protein
MCLWNPVDFFFLQTAVEFYYNVHRLVNFVAHIEEGT